MKAKKRLTRRRARGSGSVYQIGGRGPWWIAYRGPDGRRIAESSESARKGDAYRLLDRRIGARAHGLPLIPHAERLTFDEAAKAVLDDYTVNNKRSLTGTRRRIEKHLAPYFTGRRLVGITTADITAFVAYRQSQGVERRGVRVGPVSAAELNRELAALKRIFSLSIKSGRLATKPYIPMLAEDNTRKGFFEADQLGAVLAHLPADIRPAIEFAAITGWRIGEVLPLEWRQVDLAAGEVRLDAGTTKNRAGRVFPFTARLRELLDAQHLAYKQRQRAGTIAPWVFVRTDRDQPRPIGDFRGVWKAACRAAGCPGRIPHDLRRTAVRNLVRAGVPQTIAMKLTGHKTDSVFRRYDIVSPSDLRVAVERLDAARPAAASQR